MTDYHIHIGQFNEKYYDALLLFKTIEKITPIITEVFYSSTSSCRNDVELSGVEEEITYAESFQSEKLHIKPYLWFIPKYSDQNISIESAIKSFDYCGIKLHPYAQNWNLENTKHLKSLKQIFRWAHDTEKYVLIHCGPQECDLPTRFEQFFKEYPNAKVILAHSNPIEETSEMVNKYKNVFCDTACVKKEDIFKLQNLIVDRSKILFGSDFPITNYWNTHIFNKNLSLKEQYLEDCSSILLPVGSPHNISLNQ